MRNYKDNPIVKMTFEFPLQIIEFSEILREQRRFAFAELSDFSKNYPKPGKLLNDIEAILKVLNKIISTSKLRA